MTSALIMRREELGGGSWSQLEYPPKRYPSMGGVLGPAPMPNNPPQSHSTPWNTDGTSLASQITSSMPTPPESPPPARLTAQDNGGGDVLGGTKQLGLHNLLCVSTANNDRYFLTRRCCYVFHCLALKTNFNYTDIPNKVIIRDERVQSALEQAVGEEAEAAGVSEDSRAYLKLLAKHTARAHKLLGEMKAAISSTLIRLTGYVLFKVFSNLLMSVTVHGGQQEIIECAAKRDTPIIFVPLHRSHVDYLFVTWVLFNRQIPAPIVAAGDNLRIPVFGWLLRGLGGFFIKRRLDTCKSRRDVLYRSVLQTYVTHALQAGYNLEFFIEGGRTRTGKPCTPKGGLLSVIVDAYSNGTLDDALIVPIAINYDKLLDGTFIREQMGQSKIPESFWGAVRAIMTALSTNYGHARIDFGQPFSLREFVQNTRSNVGPRVAQSESVNGTVPSVTPPLSPSPLSDLPSLTLGHKYGAARPGNDNGGVRPGSLANDEKSVNTLVTEKGHQRSFSTPPANNHLVLKRTTSTPSNNLNSVNHNNAVNNLTGARSSSSLFGTDVTEDYRTLVKSLAVHIVHDAERCQAIMSTNAVAWLLSYVYREGTTLTSLTDALDALRESLRNRKRDTGFSGQSRDVVLHAVGLLGGGLVRLEHTESQKDSRDTQETDVFIRPVTLLPNIIELNYYASALAPLFAVDAIIVTSLLSLLDCDLWSYKDCSPDCLVDREKLLQRGTRLAQLLQYEFVLVPPCGSLTARLAQAIDNLMDIGLLMDAGKNRSVWCEDSDEDEVTYSVQYKISPRSSTLEVIGAWREMLAPMLDAYYHTACTLEKLIGKQMPDKEFIQNVQTYIAALEKNGSLRYGESICMDPIRNAVKLFESESVVESYTHNNIQLLYLSHQADSEEGLAPIITLIDTYRS